MYSGYSNFSIDYIEFLTNKVVTLLHTCHSPVIHRLITISGSGEGDEVVVMGVVVMVMAVVMR